MQIQSLFSPRINIMYQNKYKKSFSKNENKVICPQNFYKPVLFKGNVTNYKVYDSKNSVYKPLILERGIEFLKLCDEYTYYPKLVSRNADVSNGILSYIYMKGSDLQNSDFTDSIMSSTNLSESNLKNCNFKNTIGMNANFYKSDLENSNFYNSNFRYTNFQSARLKDCDLEFALLDYSNFIDADLTDAKNIDKAFITNSVYNSSTIFPSGFTSKGKNMFCFQSGEDLTGINLLSAKIRSEKIFDDYTNMIFKNGDLGGTEFYQLNMSNSDFSGSYCQKTDFDSCILQNSDFTNTNLEHANFRNSSLKGAKFKDSKNLSYTNFVDADLSNTDIKTLSGYTLLNSVFSDGTILPDDFTREDAINSGMIYIGKNADLSFKDFRYIKLNNFDFAGLNIRQFEHTKFYRANLQNSNLSNAYFKGTDFKKASMKHCNLQNSICRKAKFIKTNLSYSYLEGTDMSGSDLRGANLANIHYDDKTDFTDAIYNVNTVFPSNFNPKAHNMKFYEISETKRDNL